MFNALGAEGISPSQVGDSLPDKPLLSIGDDRWDRVTLQRFRHPTGLIQLPPVRDHIVALYLGGPTLLEQSLGNGRTLRRHAEAGHLSLQPSGTSFTCQTKGRSDKVLLHIQPDLVTEVSKEVFGDNCENQLLAQVGVPNPKLGHLAQLLLSEASVEDGLGDAAVAGFLVKSLIVQLLRQYSSDETRRSVASAASSDARIERALAYMQERFAEKLTAERLADVGGTSRSAFSRLFREAVGESAYQHLTAIRLGHALKLLEETRLSVTEVGYRSGFGQPNHFSTIFRERFGVSPRAWRAGNSDVEEPCLREVQTVVRADHEGF